MKFSVVIPTFNRLLKVQKAVQSVFDQTYQDFEVLVVDDGSDDTEKTLTERFDERLRYFRGSASGVAAARNFAIEQARGEWIAFLDSDDWWYPTKLQRYVEAAAAHPDVSLLYSKMDLVDADGKYILTSVIRTRENVYPAVLQGNFIFMSTAAAKKSCFERVGLLDTALSGCEDWELFVRVSRSCSALLVDEALTAYELLSAGSLSTGSERWLRAHDEVIAKSLAADPGLSRRERNRVLAGGDYAKAMIYLGDGDDRRALDHFVAAFRADRRLWRALVYRLVLSWRLGRRLLPHRVKVVLRLPEALRSTR